MSSMKTSSLYKHHSSDIGNHNLKDLSYVLIARGFHPASKIWCLCLNDNEFWVYVLAQK